MFSTLGFAGLVFAFLLLRADRRAGGVLEAPHRPHAQGLETTTAGGG